MYNQSELNAINYFNTNGGGAVLNGGITIFAAGNDEAEGNFYPGCYNGAFAVAATTNQTEKPITPTGELGWTSPPRVEKRYIIPQEEFAAL